jgi:hypothetical protein
VYDCVTNKPVCKDVWGKGCLVMYVRPARVFVLTVSIPHGFRFLYVCVCVRARASVFMLRGTQWPLVLCFFFYFLSVFVISSIWVCYRFAMSSLCGHYMLCVLVLSLCTKIKVKIVTTPDQHGKVIKYAVV